MGHARRRYAFVQFYHVSHRVRREGLLWHARARLLVQRTYTQTDMRVAMETSHVTLFHEEEEEKKKIFCTHRRHAHAAAGPRLLMARGPIGPRRFCFCAVIATRRFARKGTLHAWVCANVVAENNEHRLVVIANRSALACIASVSCYMHAHVCCPAAFFSVWLTVLNGCSFSAWKRGWRCNGLEAKVGCTAARYGLQGVPALPETSPRFHAALWWGVRNTSLPRITARQRTPTKTCKKHQGTYFSPPTDSCNSTTHYLPSAPDVASNAPTVPRRRDHGT